MSEGIFIWLSRLKNARTTEESHIAEDVIRSMFQDKNERIEELEGDVVSLQLMEKSLIQYCKDHKAHIKTLKAKLEAVIHAVYDGCDCDCRGNVNKALQEQDNE